MESQNNGGSAANGSSLANGDSTASGQASVSDPGTMISPSRWDQAWGSNPVAMSCQLYPNLNPGGFVSGG